MAMTTQWRYAVDGSPTGLDYGALQPVLRLMRKPRASWPDLFSGLRTMEAAAIEHFREKAAARG